MIARFCIILWLIVLIAGACGRVAERTATGNNAYNRGDYEEAVRNYQDAAVAQPDGALAYFNAGLAYMADRDYARALDAMLLAVENAEGALAVDAYFNLGNLYAELGRYGLAIDAYQSALRLDPVHEDTRYNLEIALLRYIPPSPTAQEQQTEPEQDQTDPDATPTNEPGGFDDPTPTPPPIEFDPTQTPVSGESPGGGDDSATPVPQSQGEMTVEQAEELLDRVQQDQQSLREFLEEVGGEGDVSEKDW